MRHTEWSDEDIRRLRDLALLYFAHDDYSSSMPEAHAGSSSWQPRGRAAARHQREHRQEGFAAALRQIRGLESVELVLYALTHRGVDKAPPLPASTPPATERFASGLVSVSPEWRAMRLKSNATDLACAVETVLRGEQFVSSRVVQN